MAFSVQLFNIKERPAQGEWLRSRPAEAGSTKNPPAKYLNLRIMCLEVEIRSIVNMLQEGKKIQTSPFDQQLYF